MSKFVGEASSEELEAEVVACIEAAGNMSETGREEVLDELELALELRGLVDRLRRRSRELRALFETAGDLSSTRDVEGVLMAIVKRGRQLLDTDVAYLMLVDEERGDTYMRVTEGTTSAGFGSIRLSPGAGLGGRVAERRIPMWTRNYQADQGYVHVIDDVVVEERLVAILGVPLQVGSKLLGTLFAADRSERDFSADEVSLLASLADHAAIAIENAAMFQATQEAVEALASANAVIEQSNDRLQRAIDLHERLMRLAAEGGELQDIATALHDVLEGAVVIRDDRGAEVARMTSTLLGDVDLGDLDLPRAAAGNEPPESGDTAVFQVGGLHAMVTPVFAANERLGTLVYVSDSVEDDTVRALERGAGVTAMLLLNRRARDEADNRVRGEILAELLLHAPGDVAAISRRASLLGVDLLQELVVVVLLPELGSMTAALHGEVSQLVASIGGLASSYADRVVALVPAAWSMTPAQDLATRLRRKKVTVGSAGPTADLGALIPLEDRARRSARLLRTLGRSGEGVSADDLGIYGLLLSEAGQFQIQTFVHRCLGPVRAYDAHRKTALVATMEAYFATDGNASAAADEMFVHVNTIYQRLERLDRLLGASWRSGDRALEIRLAIKFDAMIRDSP